jgi:curved DNA-binding protein CbpA
MGMSIEPDPYRVLGLERSASGDEIRRAYRRLAKENHPDSAGEKALPRFLAIQAAYELLAGGPATRRGGRTASTRPTPRDTWRADPDRARTTRDNSRRPGRPGSGSGTAAGPGGGGSPRSSGTAAGRGTDPAGASKGPAGDRPRREGRKRAPNKATLGSTSYDAAEDEPFEPEWSGGTWYGASSGTYWTLNPKEYADPRKHGPEYQARARRRNASSSGPASAAAGTGPSDRTGAAPADGDGSSGDGWPEPDLDEATFTWDAAAGRGLSPDPSDGLDPFAAAAHVAMNLAGTPRGFMARIGLALIGWPAIGLALATIGGEVTGCGRFAASCVDLFGVGTWLAQLVIIVILLALPSMAALSAVGSLVALAASVPTAVILSASGGSREPATSATILGVVLVMAYATGVVVALVRRRYLARLP